MAIRITIRGKGWGAAQEFFGCDCAEADIAKLVLLVAEATKRGRPSTLSYGSDGLPSQIRFPRGTAIVKIEKI